MHDLVILSNAPGEISTWVYPVWLELQRQNLPVRVSVILSPCQNACGTEADLIRSWGIDRVLPASQFWQFLLWGKTPGWDWYQNGTVLFLGGDQFYTVVIGKRLGYRTITYAEWTARWAGMIDYLALRHARISVPAKYQYKALVVGDLMLCQAKNSSSQNNLESEPQPFVVFLPGSKPHKLQVGVALSLRTIEVLLDMTDQIPEEFPQKVQVAIALAPTVTPELFMTYAPPEFGIHSAGVVAPSGRIIRLHRQFPAYELLTQASLCVTTLGANTAELASWAVPMLVVLPTSGEYMSAKVGWDGLIGLLNGNRLLAQIVNRYMVDRLRRKGQKLAWPNIWAGAEIVPELWGEITPEFLAKTIIDYLQKPEKLQEMRRKLQTLSAEELEDKLNAAQRIVALIAKLSKAYNS